MFTLRKNQEEVIQKARMSIARGNRKILIHAPTAFGKTVVAAAIVSLARDKSKETLFLANRRELIFQSYGKLTAGGNTAGVIMAGEKPDHSNDLQIASMQTYVRRMNLDERDLNQWFHDAKLIIVDEAHGAISPSYQKILKSYDDSVVTIGLTATPCRADGRGLGEYFDDIVSSDGVGKLIEDGFLVPPKYYVPSEPDLSKIRTIRGDYDQKELGERFDKPKLVGDVVSNWMKYAGGRQTIVFAVNVKHSIHLVEEFKANGIKAEHIDAKTPKEERAAILERLENGETQVVSNVGIIVEGYDCPSVSCIVLAVATKSLGKYIQMGGRGLRIFLNKFDCILIDHGGNVDSHGLLEWDREWTLDGKKKAWSKPKRENKKTVVTCRSCKLVFEGAAICPDCGTSVVSFGKHINTLDVDLKELKPTKATVADKRRFLGMLKYWVPRQKNSNHKRILGSFRGRYGVWPHSSYKDVSPIPPDQAFLNYMKHQAIKYRFSKNKNK
jgi:superfamily II DNA or RNA helicase